MKSVFEALVKVPRSGSTTGYKCKSIASAPAAYRAIEVQPMAGQSKVMVTLFSATRTVNAISPASNWGDLVGSVVSVQLLDESPHRMSRVLNHEKLIGAADAPWLEVPDPSWLIDESEWRSMVGIVRELRPSLQRVINSVLRKDDDLEGFLTLGASLADHHAERGGLLRHTLECMQVVKAQGAPRRLDLDLAISAAALHDIGKCREYTGVGQGSRLTDSGQLLGHMLAGYRMVCEALALVDLDERESLALLHCISASEAPSWVGLRSPRMSEAVLVNGCDRLSGRLEPLRPPSGSVGWYQPRAYRKQPVLSLC
jgi:hypothetical protein